MGNLGTAFADVSYMDGVMWIEKIRDPATQQVFFTIYEYLGPIEGEERKGKEVERPEKSTGVSSPPPQQEKVGI